MELKCIGADPVINDCYMHIGVDATSLKTLAKRAAAENEFV